MELVGRSGDVLLFSTDDVGVLVNEYENVVVRVDDLAVLTASTSYIPVENVAQASFDLAEAAATTLDITVVPTSDRMHTIPKSVQTEARRALDWQAFHGRGGTPAGMSVARVLAAGGQIGIRQIRHIASYFPRHEADKFAAGYSPKSESYPSAGRINCGLWGGEAAQKWAFAIVERENRRQGLSLVAAHGYYDHETPEPVDFTSFDKNGSEFAVRIRRDGSGIDRLYQIEGNGQVYVWDDGAWTDLGHINHDIDLYDRSLDEPYDTVEKDHVPVDRESAIIVAALLDVAPMLAHPLAEIDSAETELFVAAEPEIDWDELDVITAAGDGNYTPEERAQNAGAQVRDARGRFAQMGSRVIVGGNPEYAGKIVSIDGQTKSAKVQLDSGKVIDVPVNTTEKADEVKAAVPTAAPDSEPSGIDLEGILGKPKSKTRNARARLPEGLKVLNPDDLQTLLRDFPIKVKDLRSSEPAEPTTAAAGAPGKNADHLAMVALYPDEATAQKVAGLIQGIPGAYDPATLHITLVYLGEVADLPEGAAEKIPQALASITPTLPFEAQVGGQTTFGEGTTVLLIDGKGLAELHTDINRALEPLGITNASEHGFTAHMSVVDGPADDLNATGMPLVFDRFAAELGADVHPITAATVPDPKDVTSPEASDITPIYMAIVADDDPQAVMELTALVPANATSTTPVTFKRKPGKWERDDAILQDLNSPTPPPVVVLDQDTLTTVLDQIDAPAPAPVAAAGGLDRNRGNSEKLRRYWLYGKGAAKIRWNTGGDWKRCTRYLAKYIGPRAKGYCFTGDTEFITDDGIKTFSEAVGTTQRVLTHESPDSPYGMPTNFSGKWVEAPIQSYGVQDVLSVTVTRNGVQKVIRATAEHEWFASAGSAGGQHSKKNKPKTVTTIDLLPGMTLASLHAKAATTQSDLSPFGVAAGFVFGDGSHEQRKGARVDLWGTKDLEILPYFSMCRASVLTSRTENKDISGLRISGIPASWKYAPSLGEGVPYLFGWLAGYIAADGSVKPEGTVSLTSNTREHLVLAQAVATKLGIATMSIRAHANHGFGKDVTKYDLTFVSASVPEDLLILSHHKENFANFQNHQTRVRWHVVSVEDLGEREEVFCAEVPDTETFALADNIWVHNCALRHKEATGLWTGDKLHRKMYGRTASGEPVYSDAYILSTDEIIASAWTRARVADARRRVLTAGAGEIQVTEGGEFIIPLVIPEGVESGDGRIFDKGALDIRELPLPLLWQMKTDEGHNQSVIVGKITQMEQIDGGIGNGRGVFDTGPYAKEAERLCRGGFLRGVSADLDKFEADEEVEEGEPDENGDSEKVSTGKMRIRKGRVMAVTMVPKPAFEECSIQMADNEGQQEDNVIPDGVYVDDVDALAASALIACGIVSSVIPNEPPAEWFDDPKLSQATPLTVGDDGRVYGHIAAWHVDHIGMSFGTRPPRSRSNYAYFHTGVLRTEEGTDVPVGQLTLAGGHASLEMSAQEAVRHYDDTASAIADVHAGEDAYGIWIAGALRPGTAPEQIRALRASAPSGDWRPIKGRLELVGVLQVNVPGFPIARARVASGQVMALVAAGAATLARMRHDPVADLNARLTRLETEPLVAAADAARTRMMSARAEALSARVHGPSHE